MDKSFIMIRPDGGQILDGIDRIIHLDGFDITEVYSIPVWDDLYLALHKKEFEDENNSVADNIKLNVWMSKTIFGNCGLIIILDHNRCRKFSDLLSRTYDLKYKIREKFTNTRDGKFVIAINAALLDLNLQHLHRNGNLIVTSDEEQGPVNFSINMLEKGNYLPAYFNYIHCPDNSVEEVKTEYAVMREKKVLVKTNRMSSYEYDACKRMHSCYRL